MEPIRREALVKATIAEIGAQGSLDVTVARIARRAGVSSALAHHYFGGKDDMLIAAMRHILGAYGAAVRSGLAAAQSPRDRIDAILAASFAPQNYRADTVAAWLNFYVRAQSMPQARRLLGIYRGRLAANLIHALRPVAGGGAPDVAETLAALIDGIYIRTALAGDAFNPERAVVRVRETLDALLEARP
jgi:TetR/AcrR family transcriptional repressor of bet genes